ncbi:MAG: hypothetical protein DRI86_08975 [Bacteroidetes bacterium]|nr:MAG: hypothetical protein DRI86_08975 [Bacteroidota bacterium]
MKQQLILIIILFASSFTFAQVISIDSARTLGIGATVTVKGIITNGNELGGIRYFQDATGGIAAYSSSMVTTDRGDSVEVTGTIKDYNQLMEIDPVTSYTVLNSNNIMPAPVVITPAQIDNSVEGQLVKINDAVFTTTPGGLFASNSSYNFTANGETSKMYVRSNHPLIGQTIPSGLVNLTGIATQYSYTSPNDGFQLLCRDGNDIFMTTSIWITKPLEEFSISTTGLTVKWQTNISGTSEAEYGSTEALGTFVPSTGTDTLHSVDITTLSASEIVYIRTFSVSGNDTAFSPIKVFVSQSNSSGDVIAYFNTPADHSVASGPLAITLPNAIDDTLIAYINRATESIDFTMYNFTETGISSISSALNNAYDRGVDVRMIFDGSAANSGIQNVRSEIKKISNPTGSEYGIMHNKFIIFDAHSTNHNVPLVWTGGTNMTDGQVNTDPNTVIIVQDKSLAIAYTLEFNEMFGSDGLTPSVADRKFGPDKADNTPHKFIIGGKDVECYFSPSDGTNTQIIRTIDNADNNMSIATMLITRSDIAYAIEDAVNDRTVATQIIVNSEGQCSQTVWGLLSTLLGDDLQEDDEAAGIMHHKFMVADEGTSSSPTLLVGSHNWSNSADNKNDENTLVFYDNQDLANIYYQAFKYRYDQNRYVGIMETGFANSAKVYPNPSNGTFNLEIDADKTMNVEISIYDLSGRIVWNTASSVNTGINNISISATDLPAGAYLMQVVSNNKTFVSSLIIE